MPRFLAELKRRGPGNFVDIPFDPREVFGEARPPVPADLEAAFHDEARPAFERMSYTDRKEYGEWIEEARRPETRTRRVAKAVGMIREGKPQR